MTSYSPRAIRTAVKELLQGEIGTLRTLEQGVFKYGVFAGQRLPAEQAISLMDQVGRHWFSIKLGRFRPSTATAINAIGNERLAEKAITISVLTHLPASVQEDERDDVEDSVDYDMFLAAEALGYPGNLEQTRDAESTGIVSAAAFAEPEFESTADWDAQLMRSRIDFVVALQLDREV